MARSRKEIISEMVDSGLFSDDEIRNAVKSKGKSKGGFLGKASAAPVGAVAPPPPPVNVAGGMARPASMPSGFEMESPEERMSWLSPGVKREISRAANVILPVGGAVGGGALGTGATSFTIAGVPAGLAAGGALGYAGGKTAAGALDEFMGLKPRTKTLKEAAGKTVSAIGEGIQNEALGLTIGAPLKALRNLPKTKFGQRAASAVFGPKPGAIAERMTRPDAIKNAPSFSQIADEIPQSLTMLDDGIKNADDAAWKTLKESFAPEEGAIPKRQMIDRIRSIQREINVRGGGVIGGETKKTFDKLSSLIDQISSVGPDEQVVKEVTSYGKLGVPEISQEVVTRKPEFVSESSLKGIVQSIDQDINWDDTGRNFMNQTLARVRGNLDDVLKTQNKTYAEAMKPVAALTDLKNQAKIDFGIKHEPGKGYIRSDATVAKLKTIPTDRKDVSRKTLEKLGAVTRKPFLQAVEDSATAKQFEGGKIQGSRKVNLGLTVGGGLGSGLGYLIGRGPIAAAMTGAAGATGGAMTGAYLDEQGGPILAKLIDAYLKRRLPGEELASPLMRAITAAFTNATNPTQ